MCSLQIVFRKSAQKELNALPSKIKAHILDYMDTVAKSTNPRRIGRAMKGEYSGLYRYRIGSYRVICNIIDDILVIEVIKVSSRQGAYK